MPFWLAFRAMDDFLSAGTVARAAAVAAVLFSMASFE